MKFSITSFRGEAPRVTPRELPDNAAQEATNCRLQTGDLESWRQFLLSKTLANTGTVQTIYLLNGAWLSWNAQVDVARGVIPGDTTFRTFLTAPGTYTTPRYTTYALATTGAEPYPVTTLPLGVPEPDTAPTLVVGVNPAADTAVSVTDDGSNIATAWTIAGTLPGNREATQDAVNGNPAPCYRMLEQGTPGWMYRDFGTEDNTATTFDCDFYFETGSGNHQAGFAVGNTAAGGGARVQIGTNGTTAVFQIGTGDVWSADWVATSLMGLTMVGAHWYHMTITTLTNREDTTTVTAKCYDGATLMGTLTLRQPFQKGGFHGLTMHLTTDTQATRYDNIVVTGSGSLNPAIPVNTAMSYVYTFINNLGEESAPSPVSSTVLRPDGVQVTITTPTAAPGGTDPLYNIVSKRIYRAVTGSGGTVYKEVTTIALATATYVDTKEDDETGPNILESEDWDLPPATLQGIIALPNGIMAGFFGNQLCFSARARPHAWPVLYRLPTDTDIVAIANIDNTVVIGTKSFVYTATGNDPASYSMSQPGAAQACVSKRSMRYLDKVGVVFASPDGYMVCRGSAGKVDNATEGIFTRRQWEALVPSSIIAGVHDSVLHFFFTGTTPDAGYALDAKPNGFGLIRLSYHATALHSDPLTDGFYLVLDVNNEPTDSDLPVASTAVTPNGLKIFQFDAGASNMVFRWRGKLNLTAYPLALTIAQVRALSYSNLLFRVYADGAVIHEQVVSNDKEFTLPALDTYGSYEFEFMGTSTARSGQAAEDVLELT